MYKLVFFVPSTHLDAVKSAVFAAGGGRVGNYDCCAWQTLGMGQFRPLPGSQPYLGDIHQLTTIEEYRVEMVCADECVAQVILSLRQSHPYEEPAYDLWRLADL